MTPVATTRETRTTHWLPHVQCPIPSFQQKTKYTHNSELST
ncbi:hypothetical protein [Tolypothrix sp. FACHB-123]|nr:hypothetical protein [Tolypothrix sp. FACHB-123]